MDDSKVKTKEIVEAAIFYTEGLRMVAYRERHWEFADPECRCDGIRVKLINREMQVEPLAFQEAVRRVKSFSSGPK